MKLVEVMMSSDKQATTAKFDVGADLQEFMVNDSEFYRQHYYPCVYKLPQVEPRRAMFNIKNMIECGVKLYAEKFDVEQEVQESFGKDQINELAKGIYELEMQNCRAGMYNARST